MNPYTLLLISSFVITFALLFLLDTFLEKRKRKKKGQPTKLPGSFFVAHGFTYLAFMLGTAILTATFWMKANFNETDLSTLFFHMHVKITSNDIKNFKGLYLWIFVDLIPRICGLFYSMAVRKTRSIFVSPWAERLPYFVHRDP